MPGLFAIAQFDCRKRFLQSTQHSDISTKTQALTWLLQIGWCYMLIEAMGLGLYGAALALNITYITTYTIQEVYVTVYKKTMFEKYYAPLFEEESFLEWPRFMKIGAPTTILNCIEWWCFEIIVLFAGTYGVKELTA